MITEIARDIWSFLVVMVVLVTGFAGAFYFLFTQDEPPPGAPPLQPPPPFRTFSATLLSTFLMMIGDFDIGVFREGTPHSWMAIGMFCAYQLLGMIVLLNLLIAIMGDTFARCKDATELRFWKGRCDHATPPDLTPSAKNRFFPAPEVQPT